MQLRSTRRRRTLPLDFDIAPELRATAGANTHVRRRGDHSARSPTRAALRTAHRGAASRADREGACREAPLSARRARVRRPRACRISAGPSLSRRPATRRWARSRSTCSRRTRATCICSRPSPVRRTRSAGCGRWRAGEHPIVLLHDRAAAGRGIRPVDAGDDRARATAIDYVISGGKWFITGADGASFAIIMAKADDAGATMFLSDMNARGHLARAVDGQPRHLLSRRPRRGPLRRSCACRAATSSASSGKGFKYAQVRLSPARLTHCMRWLGAARRAHDIAVDYARKREAFGKRIGEHEGVGFMLADNEMDMHVARLAIWHCAWVLDRGELALHESSRAKVIVSEALWRVVDRCVQMLGGQGVTGRDRSSHAFLRTCARFASTTARPRCIAGASPSEYSEARATRRAHARRMQILLRRNSELGQPWTFQCK